jgi:hypothetical protein
MGSLRSRRPTYGTCWKADESLHEIGRALGKIMARFISCYRGTAGSLR